MAPVISAAMTDNEKARGDAKAIRDKENADFVAEEADMTGAIDQMDKALETLAAVGADQTALTAVGTTRSKFLGTEQESSKVPVTKLSDEMKKALKAASVFLPSKQRKSVAGFIQAPFTGDYSAQSGEIVGILKNMRDTFSTNLGNARASEAAALRAFDAYTGVMEGEHSTMADAKSGKEDELGGNDESLGTAQENLEGFNTKKGEDEQFLAELTQMCADKTK